MSTASGNSPNTSAASAKRFSPPAGKVRHGPPRVREPPAPAQVLLWFKLVWRPGA